MAEKKTIRLDFFQLAPSSKSKDDPTEKAKAIKTVLSSIDETVTFKPLIKAESQVCLYGKLQKRSSFILGTLVKSQMSEIPPRFNVKTGDINELNLSDSEGLAYATCFLFDPTMNMLVIEGIANGVTSHAFCGFLMKNLDLPAIEPVIVIDPIDMERFMKMNMIHNFSVKIAKVENGSIFSSPKKSIVKITDSATDTNATLLEYKIQAKKKSQSLSLSLIKQMVQDFFSYKDSEEVLQLTVTGSEHEEATPQMIDFIKQRMRDKIEVERQRLIGSFSIAERFDLMDSVYAKHRPGLLSAYKIP